MSDDLRHLLRGRRRETLGLAALQDAGGLDAAPENGTGCEQSKHPPPFAPSAMDTIENLLEERENLAELSKWLGQQEYLTIQEVKDHTSVSRTKIDDQPRPVLPWLDMTPRSQRTIKRFRPTDVFALPAIMRAWERAIEQGVEDEFLEERRERLQERDDKLRGLALGYQLEDAA